MTELTDLDEASLAEHAAQWRLRALRGEKQARGIAHALETEVRRRSGDTLTQNLDLDTRPQALRLAPRPWWKFW